MNWLSELGKLIYDSREIIYVIGAILGVLAAIWGIIKFLLQPILKLREERKKENDNKLKTHFTEIKTEAESTMSETKVVEMYGAIVAEKGLVPLYHPNFIGIELPVFSKEFIAHFPREIEEYKKCIGEILKHNKSYKGLLEKIKLSFQSRGLAVVSANHPSSVSPCIYDNIFPPLFNWWQDRSKSKAKPWPNFQIIEPHQDSGPDLLWVSGWNSGAIARAVKDSDRQRCKEVIARVAENEEYQTEAVEIIKLAKERMTGLRTFKEQLLSTLNDIETFWPGTRKYKFRKVRNCPRCKELFH